MSAVTERMERLGHADGVVQIQVQKLSSFGAHAKPKRLRLLGPDQVRGEDDEEFDDGWNLVGPIPKRMAPIDGGVPVDSPDDEADLVQESAPGGREEKEEKVVPRGLYVLSIIGRCEKKTLHRVGECHRIPGGHYGKCQVVGNGPPPVETFHQSCKICFPQGDRQAEDSGSELSEEDDNSSSDSSTSVEESGEEG